jgi:hypothetical protein
VACVARLYVGVAPLDPTQLSPNQRGQVQVTHDTGDSTYCRRDETVRRLRSVRVLRGTFFRKAVSPTKGISPERALVLPPVFDGDKYESHIVQLETVRLHGLHSLTFVVVITHTKPGNNVRTEWQSEMYTIQRSKNWREKKLNEWGTKLETYRTSDIGSLANPWHASSYISNQEPATKKYITHWISTKYESQNWATSSKAK